MQHPDEVGLASFRTRGAEPGAEYARLILLGLPRANQGQETSRQTGNANSLLGVTFITFMCEE